MHLGYGGFPSTYVILYRVFDGWEVVYVPSEVFLSLDEVGILPQLPRCSSILCYYGSPRGSLFVVFPRL